MSDESERFRQRARDCRQLSENARNSVDRAELQQMADDVDSEAETIARLHVAARPEPDEVSDPPS